MRHCKPVILVAAFLWMTALITAQVRENAVQLDDASVPAGQSGETSGTALSLHQDATSTSVTGARVSLGAGDLLEIVVFDTPELTQKVRVDSEGNIRLQLIGEIRVQGMTADAVGKTVTQKLVEGHFVKDPQVSVFVSEYAGQMGYITGEVTRPGAYPLLRSHRLQDIISLAGGLSPRAGATVTIARENDQRSPQQIDLNDPDENRRNPEIHPGDNISVSKSGVVYVLGEVGRPGGFLLDRRASLSAIQALALAEGAKPSASLDKARLIRTTKETRDEINVNLKTMLLSQSPDLPLQAGDILYVPGSMWHGMGRRSIETILATASGVAVYAYRP